MDYTTIYRPLVYKDREDIDDFPVDETDNIDYLTMEAVFMEKLEARPFIKESYNAPELILMIFNNARYITTLICSENHPQHYLHKYLKIAENDRRLVIMCNHTMPATMALVVNYLLHYEGEFYYGSKIVKAIIENFKDWDTKGASEGKQDFYDLLIDRTSETDSYSRWTTDGNFERRDIRTVITDYSIDSIEFMGSATNYIIGELFGKYDDSDIQTYLVAFKKRIKNFESSCDLIEGGQDMVDIAYIDLKKAFNAAGIQWEEDNHAPGLKKNEKPDEKQESIFIEEKKNYVKEIDWVSATNNFNLDTIKGVVNSGRNKRERRSIIRAIRDAMIATGEMYKIPYSVDSLLMDLFKENDGSRKGLLKAYDESSETLFIDDFVRYAIEEYRYSHTATDTERLKSFDTPPAPLIAESDKISNTTLDNTPEDLKSPEAEQLMQKLINAGIINEEWQPVNLSIAERGYLADEISSRLKIKSKWKVMGALWNENSETLRQGKNKAVEQTKTGAFIDKLKKILD
jgi:hypothetical protein